MTGSLFRSKKLQTLSIAIAFAIFIATASVANCLKKNNESWSFGVISDTQLTITDDGYNLNTVAANIIKQIDQQCIAAGVDLVVAVGDTVNNGNKVNIDPRALYAQELYNAGIGFYPLRGNHEAAHGDPDNLESGSEMRYAFRSLKSKQICSSFNSCFIECARDYCLGLISSPQA